MPQGVWINVGDGAKRPRTKRELAEACTVDPGGVVLEPVAAGQPDGRITDPWTWEGHRTGRMAYTAVIVGPEPETNRKWTAELKVRFNPEFLAVVK